MPTQNTMRYSTEHGGDHRSAIRVAWGFIIAMTLSVPATVAAAEADPYADPGKPALLQTDVAVTLAETRHW